MKQIITISLSIMLFFGCSAPKTYDVLIKNGNIYDGYGAKPYVADIGINSDTIAFIGNLENTELLKFAKKPPNIMVCIFHIYVARVINYWKVLMNCYGFLKNQGLGQSFIT